MKIVFTTSLLIAVDVLAGCAGTQGVRFEGASRVGQADQNVDRNIQRRARADCGKKW